MPETSKKRKSLVLALCTSCAILALIAYVLWDYAGQVNARLPAFLAYPREWQGHLMVDIVMTYVVTVLLGFVVVVVESVARVFRKKGSQL